MNRKLEISDLDVANLQVAMDTLLGLVRSGELEEDHNIVVAACGREIAKVFGRMFTPVDEGSFDPHRN